MARGRCLPCSVDGLLRIPLYGGNGEKPLPLAWLEHRESSRYGIGESSHLTAARSWGIIVRGQLNSESAPGGVSALTAARIADALHPRGLRNLHPLLADFSHTIHN